MDLAELREKIDTIDKDILSLIASRFEVVKKISQLKKQKGLPVFDKTREKKLHEKIAGVSEDFGLGKTFTKKLFEMILEESKRLQRNGK